MVSRDTPYFWEVPELHTARKVIILRAVGNSLELFGTLGNLAFWTFRILEFRGSPRNSIVYSMAYQILGRALKVPKYTIGFQSQVFRFSCFSAWATTKWIAELSRRSNQAANFLSGLGLKRYDRMLLLLGNVAPLWEVMLAAPKLGVVVANPREPRQKRLRVRSCLRRRRAAGPSPSQTRTRPGLTFCIHLRARAPFSTSGWYKLVARFGVGAKLGFKVHPHMLRHACSFQLANQGTDTPTLQAYLGHRNIQHTVRYTELSPTRFKNLWRD